MKFAVCLLGLVAVANAHLCLLSPKQRGTVNNVGAPGSPDCFLTTSPCGGRTKETPQVYYAQGSTVTVIFEKNADHTAPNRHGHYDISLWLNDHKTKLATVQDGGQPAPYVFTQDVNLPNNAVGEAVLQIDYITGNPDVPYTFYQCSDIMINAAGAAVGK